MKCPICKRATDPQFRPFCSKRCADVDLAKWINGSYAVPSDDPDDIEEALNAVLNTTETPGKPH
ncbi:DNA gyrase inhibitor YacG [Puniceibacterium confluentis]|uniref:DNA gyrase inhibitor YacG n=1 Tax=Puniceibacterium confluentis TaxID=1958944 RepID=UPI0011B689B0|nr:DNA gyrase inhibitor YacG [Puniceibacterium confluentis]